MDRSLALRAALWQTGLVLVLFVPMAVVLPHSFFEDWGWGVGPAAWAICALITARILGLHMGWTLLGAFVAGIPSLLAVVIGVHSLGMLIAVVVFGVWCGYRVGDPAARKPVTA